MTYIKSNNTYFATPKNDWKDRFSTNKQSKFLGLFNDSSLLMGGNL